jgi:hypothetical protein
MKKKSVAAKKSTALPYVIVRSAQAGVFAGFLKSRKGTEAVLQQARRLWYWDGAASLSQLSMEGVSRPQNCKFPPAVEEALILGVIEVLSTTERALISIQGVPVWRA